MKLRARAERAFGEALAAVEGRPALRALRDTIEECRRRLDQPMRVAIVGFIKAGKSTTMNALLGEELVATGTVEATFNVNWLKWGDPASLLVHFKDGRPAEEKSFDELSRLTLRADDNREYLTSIKHIEVFHPNPLLKTFNLIDTPGLSSFFKEDSQNTLDFLRLHGEELTAVTKAEAANADAVLYLFSQSVRAEDKSIVEQFQGPAMGNPTPINAIGVLTKIDFYWPDREDPLEAGRQIAARHAEDPRVRRIFYTVCPASGLLAVGAQTLTDEDFGALASLSALPGELFGKLARNVGRFVRENPEIPVSGADRQRVLDRLGMYGVTLACRLIREGAADRAALSAALFERSGLAELRDLVVSHFGNRAFLIKLDAGLKQIERACFEEQRRARGQDAAAVEDVASLFDDLATNEHAFRELKALRAMYEGKLEFDEAEARQMLEVTGEYGGSAGERLGLGERATVAEMAARAAERTHYWRSKANDFAPVGRDTIFATEVLARSYELLLHNVKKAQEYLNL